MKWLLYLICSSAILGATIPEEFDLLMGKDTPEWHYIQTPEDWKRYSEFKKSYAEQIHHLHKNNHKTLEIPTTLHVIWLGPHEFPKKSILHIGKWMKHHPDWTIKFWTDTDAAPPIEGMIKCEVREFPFAKLGDFYIRAEHYIEKAKMLAYEILYKEGGVYVSQDVVPFKNFTPLNKAYHFYCGLEHLSSSMLSTSIFPSTHVIGGAAGHPVLEETLNWIVNEYDRLETMYSGNRPSEVMNRITHRTVWALAEGIDRGMHKGGRNIVFPSLFFNDPTRRAGSYAIYLRNDHWSKQFTPFENKVTSQLTDIVKQTDEGVWTMVIVGTMSTISCLVLLYLILLSKRRRHA